MDNRLLIATNIYKKFGDQQVSNNISIELNKGEIYGLLGPNGAGKTTLIRMLSTITQPDQGEILFQGKPLQSSDSQFMGYMPEERGLYKKMSVADQLLFFAELRGLSNQDAKAAVKHWLGRLEMLEWSKKKIEEISKGMAQKVQFVSCIMHKPKLLILDEPFSGFDPVNADMIKNLILELKNEGTSILFSTHRMDNVEELCDKIGIIHQGKKVLDGSVSEIRRNAFTGIFEIGFHGAISFEQHPLGAHVIKSTQTNDGRYIYYIQTSESLTMQQLLQQASTLSSPLIHYSEHIPTVHDIFVKTVEGSGDEFLTFNH